MLEDEEVVVVGLISRRGKEIEEATADRKESGMNGGRCDSN